MNCICYKNNCTMFSVFIIVFAFVFALIEIEIEGKDGWAKHLPTPHLTKNNKSLTIYHVYIFLFVFLSFNMVFFAQSQLINWRNTLYILSMTLMFFFLEDMYWFLSNPFHSILKQNSWHTYVGPVPLLYIVLPTLAFIIAALAKYTKTFLWSLLVFIIGSVIMIGVGIGYKHYYRWTHKDYINTLNATTTNSEDEQTIKES